jgi:hypothetical protein
MENKKEYLELRILDADPGVGELRSGFAGRIRSKDEELYVTGGPKGLLWYHPETGEKGIVDTAIDSGVGLMTQDVDGDGIDEIFSADCGSYGNRIVMYKYNGKTWDKHFIDRDFPGHPHDIVFADIDGDGIKEFVTISCYSDQPGVYIYKPDTYEGKLPVSWKKHIVQEGVFTEGVSIGDINGDGKMEIISGPDWYEQPQRGPFAGEWTRRVYASTYREMCRTALVDITGNGVLDIVITDSEYMDGTLSWYENRLNEEGADWVEHRLCDRIVYSHSLEVNTVDGGVDIFTAEMEQGGWDAPYNYDARLLLYSTRNQGKTWTERELYRGEGTHQATIRYGDKKSGRGIEVYGKTLGRYWDNPRVQLFTSKGQLEHLEFKHSFVDRDKPAPGTDALAFSPLGEDLWLACSRFVYRPIETGSGWERLEIPETSQILNSYDIDGDGCDELIVTYSTNDKGEREIFSSDLYWKKMTLSSEGEVNWETGKIGTGHGDWPHGSLTAPILPGNKSALITAYHSAHNGGNHPPQLWTIPGSLKAPFWEVSNLGDVLYGEELLTAHISGTDLLDVVAGHHWYRNNGDGSFTPFRIVDDFAAARMAVMDITGNGKPDLLMVEEKVDYDRKLASFVRFVWFECPDNPEEEWPMHLIDTVRSPHSLSCGDVDNDGISEVFMAEHDPFWPYRQRNRLFVYKTSDRGKTWARKTIDSRFEHHDGARLIDLPKGKKGLLSHGWNDTIYMHLWEIKQTK